MLTTTIVAVDITITSLRAIIAIVIIVNCLDCDYATSSSLISL
jgi:hypothetical protein